MKTSLSILGLLFLPIGFVMGQTSVGTSASISSGATTVSTEVLKKTTAPVQISGGADEVVYVTKVSSSEGTTPAKSDNKATPAVCSPAPVITATDGAPTGENKTSTPVAEKPKTAQSSANTLPATVVAPVTATGDNKIAQP